MSVRKVKVVDKSEIGTITGAPIGIPGFKDEYGGYDDYDPTVQQTRGYNYHDYHNYAGNSPCADVITDILSDDSIPASTRLNYQIKMLGSPWNDVFVQVEKQMKQMMMTMGGKDPPLPIIEVKDPHWGTIQIMLTATYRDKYAQRFIMYLHVNNRPKGVFSFQAPYNSSTFMTSDRDTNDMMLQHELYEQVNLMKNYLIGGS